MMKVIPEIDDEQRGVPMIYVSCLTSYNNGAAFGEWIDATMDPSLMAEEIEAMLERGPYPEAEEYAIHASSGFGQYMVPEHMPLSEVHDIAEFVEEHGALAKLLLCFHSTHEEAITAMASHYLGKYSQFGEYARMSFEDTISAPNIVKNNIDYEKIERDLCIGGDIYRLTLGSEVHIFVNR